MAEGSGTGTLDYKKGYPRQVLIDQNIDSKYLCIFCELILRRPKQSYCGHRSCCNCSEAFLRNENISHTCPACIAEESKGEDSILKEENTFPDNAILRELYKKEAQCPNKDCNWKALFKKYPEHEETCPFQRVACDCGVLVLAAELQEHQQNDCTRRVQKCPVCEVVMQKDDSTVSAETSLEKHITDNLAPHIILIGTDVAKIKRKLNMPAIADSLAEEEEASPVEEAPIGATAGTVDESALEERVASIEQGLHSIVSSVSDLQKKGQGEGGFVVREPNAEARSPPNGDLLEDLENRVVLTNYKAEAFESGLFVMRQQLESSRSEIHQQAAGLDDLRGLVSLLQQQVSVRDHKIEMLENKIQEIESTSYDGVFTWKISGFSSKQVQAANGTAPSVYSPSFYSDRAGYKMCARIYPNGDGMGKGTHLSLFFVVMKGQHDALLNWPFRRKVTMMMLDQNNKEHVIDGFRPDPNSSSFKKPTSEMNIASGCPMFCELPRVLGTKPLYVKDDCVFIRIVVDREDSN